MRIVRFRSSKAARAHDITVDNFKLVEDPSLRHLQLRLNNPRRVPGAQVSNRAHVCFQVAAAVD